MLYNMFYQSFIQLIAVLFREVFILYLEWKNYLLFWKRKRLKDAWWCFCCHYCHSSISFLSYQHSSFLIILENGNQLSPKRVAAKGYCSESEWLLFLIRLTMLGPKLKFRQDQDLMGQGWKVLRNYRKAYNLKNLIMMLSMMNWGGCMSDFLVKCSFNIWAGFIHL